MTTSKQPDPMVDGMLAFLPDRSHGFRDPAPLAIDAPGMSSDEAALFVGGGSEIDTTETLLRLVGDVQILYRHTDGLANFATGQTLAIETRLARLEKLVRDLGYREVV